MAFMEEEKPIRKDINIKRKRLYAAAGRQLGGDNNNIAQVAVSDSESDDDNAVNTFFMSSNKKQYSSKETVRVDATTKKKIIKPKHSLDPDNNDEEKENVCNNKIIDNRAHAVEKESSKKKKKKHQASDENADIINNNTTKSENNNNHKSGDHEKGEKQVAATRSITHPSDFLLIEDIQLGKSYEKMALLGEKVSVHFTCKIDGNGQLVSSNMNGKPLKILLGLKEIMRGLDDGIVGMRVGGKRRITIPPSIWRDEGHDCKKIRSKASLVYEIHLINVIG